MSDVDANLAFWTQLAELQKERDEAFATRDKDVDRWRAAKQAYAEFRTAMRVYGGRPTDIGVTAQAGTADVKAKGA